MTKRPDPILQQDPDRLQWEGTTDIYLRGRNPAGDWVSCDIATLNRESLVRLCRHHGQPWTVQLVLLLLDHPATKGFPGIKTTEKH
jgi:hypothetical protein